MTADHHPHPVPGLTDLSRVVLTGANQTAYEVSSRGADGDPVWRARKMVEARDLCALAEIAPRLTIESLALGAELRAIVRLRTPVPCRFSTGDLSSTGDLFSTGDPSSTGDRFSTGDLVIAQEAVLGIQYPREAMLRPLPGTGFVQVLRPLGTFLPTVSEGPIQIMCLGASLPLGIRVTELVMMAFRSLALQDHTIDERDPAGIFRRDAARYYQENRRWLPLTKEPFIQQQQVATPRREGEEVSHG